MKFSNILLLIALFLTPLAYGQNFYATLKKQPVIAAVGIGAATAGVACSLYSLHTRFACSGIMAKPAFCALMQQCNQQLSNYWQTYGLAFLKQTMQPKVAVGAGTVLAGSCLAIFLKNRYQVHKRREVQERDYKQFDDILLEEEKVIIEPSDNAIVSMDAWGDSKEITIDLVMAANSTVEKSITCTFAGNIKEVDLLEAESSTPKKIVGNSDFELICSDTGIKINYSSSIADNKKIFDLELSHANAHLIDTERMLSSHEHWIVYADNDLQSFSYQLLKFKNHKLISKTVAGSMHVGAPIKQIIMLSGDIYVLCENEIRKYEFQERREDCENNGITVFSKVPMLKKSWPLAAHTLKIVNRKIVAIADYAFQVLSGHFDDLYNNISIMPDTINSIAYGVIVAVDHNNNIIVASHGKQKLVKNRAGKPAIVACNYISNKKNAIFVARLVDNSVVFIKLPLKLETKEVFNALQNYQAPATELPKTQLGASELELEYVDPVIPVGTVDQALPVSASSTYSWKDEQRKKIQEQLSQQEIEVPEKLDENVIALEISPSLSKKACNIEMLSVDNNDARAGMNEQVILQRSYIHYQADTQKFHKYGKSPIVCFKKNNGTKISWISKSGDGCLLKSKDHVLFVVKKKPITVDTTNLGLNVIWKETSAAMAASFGRMQYFVKPKHPRRIYRLNAWSDEVYDYDDKLHYSEVESDIQRIFIIKQSQYAYETKHVFVVCHQKGISYFYSEQVYDYPDFFWFIGQPQKSCINFEQATILPVSGGFIAVGQENIVFKMLDKDEIILPVKLRPETACIAHGNVIGFDYANNLVYCTPEGAYVLKHVAQSGDTNFIEGKFVDTENFAFYMGKQKDNTIKLIPLPAELNYNTEFLSPYPLTTT